MTKLDRYPLPALTTFNERLAGCSVFSKIDLRQAFQQVHVDEASQDKTAIITTLGLFKFLRMPYGLKNAAQCFQRSVHQLLSDMPFAHFLYMDDLIVGSKCKEDHVRDLQCLFQRLKDKGLLLNKNKCKLGEPSLTFLGHVVDSGGISIPTERVEAIKRFPVPTTPKELERFLGICAFFHRFVRHASGKMAPLSQLKNLSRQKDFEEAWNPVHDRAFCATKEAIANATLLVHPLPKAQTEIWCDASNIAVGAVLVQFQRGLWKPLSFWSKQLNHAQRGYSATDRELLAVSYAVDKFRAYLEGQPIIVRTDHQPLVGALTKKADTALPVPRRHLLKIAQFVDQLHYLKGEINGVADALSRVQLQPKQKMAANCIVAAVSASDEQDILPEEGWSQAVQEEALVDDTFLRQLQRRRDLQNKQLQTPACVRGSGPPSVVSNQVPHANEANYSPIPSTMTVVSDSPTCCVAGATHRSVTSSNTVDYAPRQPGHAAASSCRIQQLLPLCPRLQRFVSPRSATRHCRGGSLTIIHRRPGSNQAWLSARTTQRCGQTSMSRQLILVPTALQRVVFDSLHCLAHPWVKAGMTLIKRTYWWQGIGKDVARWTKSCEACQKAKVHKHTKVPLERLPAPTKRFSHIHVDLVGPLNPACEWKNTLLTVIDRWTGWPEAFPMTMHGDAANTKACAKVLVRQWIARWAVPDIITSDRGSQVTSDLWLEVCRFMGTARDPTTSYHPQHNGKVEWMHRCLKNSLRARLLGRANWLAELPWVMLGLRAAANLDTGVSPSMLVTCQQPALPGQLAVSRANIDDASAFGKELASAMAAQTFRENPWHGKEKLRARVPQDLWMTKLVLVRVDKQQPSLEPKYTGPFRVLRRWGKCFRLRLENRDDNVSVDRLRPFYEEDTGCRSQTGQTTNNADIGSAIAEEENKPVNDPEQLPTLGSRSKRTVHPPNRLGFGRIVSTTRLEAMIN